MNAILRLVNSEKNNIVFGRYNLNKCNLYDLVMIKKILSKYIIIRKIFEVV